MQSRSEAINYLQSQGYEAFARDWILGQTIGIHTGRKQEVKVSGNSITVWDGVLYIYPVEEKWAIDDSSPFDEIEKRYSSLLEAVLAAEAIAKSRNQDKGIP